METRKSTRAELCKPRMPKTLHRQKSATGTQLLSLQRKSKRTTNADTKTNSYQTNQKPKKSIEEDNVKTAHSKKTHHYTTTEYNSTLNKTNGYAKSATKNTARNQCEMHYNMRTDTQDKYSNKIKLNG